MPIERQSIRPGAAGDGGAKAVLATVASADAMQAIFGGVGVNGAMNIPSHIAQPIWEKPPGRTLTCDCLD
jgi:hypothetical protein